MDTFVTKSLQARRLPPTGVVRALKLGVQQAAKGYLPAAAFFSQVRTQHVANPLPLQRLLCLGQPRVLSRASVAPVGGSAAAGPVSLCTSGREATFRLGPPPRALPRLPPPLNPPSALSRGQHRTSSVPTRQAVRACPRRHHYLHHRRSSIDQLLKPDQPTKANPLCSLAPWTLAAQLAVCAAVSSEASRRYTCTLPRRTRTSTTFSARQE